MSASPVPDPAALPPVQSVSPVPVPVPAAPGAAPPAAPDPDVFRRVAGRFASGVCVLSTVHRGQDHAMTASAFVSVSLEPLLVLACIEVESRFHEAVLESGTWGVSILDAGSRGVSDWLATRGRPLTGQLDRVPFHRGPVTGAALVDGALGWLEVRTTDVHPAGDHSLVVGEVTGLGLGPDDARPLLYYRSAYASLGA